MRNTAKKAHEKPINLLNAKPIKEKENKEEEYDSDSSDEEMIVRTGNIPSEWYNSYRHVGYDITSKRVAKGTREDEIEKFMKQANDKNWWRSIYDPKNNRTMYLSDKDLALINRVRKNYYLTKAVEDNNYFEQDIPYQVHALSNHIPSKRSFELSKNERKTINRLIYMYKNGFMSMDSPLKEKDNAYDIWEFEDNNTLTDHPSVGFKAPKRLLPETEESYNPPNINEDSSEQAVLRKIPMYPKLMDEELDRCSDLFLSARVIKKKTDIKESDLLPDLPQPEELRPFPTKETILYKGHQSSIRAISSDASGNVLISSDNGGFIHFYDIMSAKIICRIDVKEKIFQIQPNPQMNLIAICCETQIYFLIPKYLSKKARDALHETINDKITPLIIQNQEKQSKEETDQKEHVTVNDAFIWKIPKPSSKKAKKGIVFYMQWLQGKVSKLAWHSKGDYFSTLSKNSQGKAQVFIHSLSKMTHQCPFSKIKGNVNSMSFHPTKPYFIVATNSNIFIYNLQKQELIRKFISNLGTISNIAIHNSGSDIIAGAKDGKVAWFQLELSNKPFKQMNYHQDKVKAVAFHRAFPLFFSASRNGKLLLYHCQGTEDELTDPLIVPLKVLKPSHTQNNVYTCAAFHPKQPWIFSGGEDGLIRLWS